VALLLATIAGALLTAAAGTAWTTQLRLIMRPTGASTSDTHWSDADRQYDSLPNYIAMTTGQSGPILAPFTCDCAPSPSVSVAADNIFRQVPTAGGTERSYAEGMSGNCSDSGTTLRPQAQSGALHGEQPAKGERPPASLLFLDRAV
jgi:hypothetical protein